MIKKRSIFLGAYLLWFIWGLSPLLCAAEQTRQPAIENLAFKILQKQAAEYEVSLSQLINDKLKKYIPEDRYYISVRIYWNPYQIEQLKSKKELKRKSGKLPGFPIFVKEEEKGIDYYLGAGSVMKLKVEVLLDETMSKKYADFIYQIIPVQARFVPERGDSVKVVSIPFPKSKVKKITMKEDVPLVGDEASSALISSIEKGKKQLSEMQPVILPPAIQKYVLDYEKQTSEKLKQTIAEYVEGKSFLLSVKFFWNPAEMKKLKKLVKNSDVEGKVKLPGFTIFLEERESIYEMISNSATLLRMEISILLDSSVSPEVDPFLKKMVPMSIKIIPQRGDLLTIIRGNFPKTGDQINFLAAQRSDKALQSDFEVENEINAAFNSADYRKGLILVDLLLSKKTDPYERIGLLKKKGSLHLLLQETELAKAAWEQVKRMNPESRQTIRFLEHIK